MEKRDMVLYMECEDEVSNEHPWFCVCGKLATGLHEMNCKKFKQAVERRYNKAIKSRRANNTDIST